MIERLARRRLPPLPASFLFGVATADHQCEAYEPHWEDIRDLWARAQQLVPRGRATDFWRRFGEDIALARELGCTAFRFSVAWARVEPRPGEFDPAALDHYAAVVAAVRAAGMEPIVTLHHFTWPVHLEAAPVGGMTGPLFPARFERYAAEVARRLGPAVRYWVTFNEPTQLVYGYVKPWWLKRYPSPPGLPPEAGLAEQTAALGRLIRNLFLAHTAARAAIKAANPAALVGANPLLLGLPRWLQEWVDRNARRVQSEADLLAQSRAVQERTLLDHGQADLVIATLTVTAEREREADFSEVYYVAAQRLLVRADSPLAGAPDLAGRPVAVVQSSTAERRARAVLDRPHLVVLPDYDAALAALERRDVDAILSDDTILRGLAARRPGAFRIVGERLTDEPYGAAVPQGDRALLAVVNAAVRRFKASGAWAASYARHLGEPVPAPPAEPQGELDVIQRARLAELAPGGAPDGGWTGERRPSPSLERIRARGYLRVAVKSDVPGFGYRDPETGAWSGLEIDLARAVAAELFGDSGKVELVPATTRQRLPLLRTALRALDPIVKPLLERLSVVSTLLTSNWWHLGMKGELSPFLCPPSCVGQQDFVGFDYYWGIRALRLDLVGRLFGAGFGEFDRAPVWPGVLHDLLQYHAKLFPDRPILIVENGCVPEASGVKRAEYLRRHIRQVQRAVRDGVNVAGYVCWSITTNHEWGFPHTAQTDFGLFAIDLGGDPELRRVRTPDAELYAQIIARRSV